MAVYPTVMFQHHAGSGCLARQVFVHRVGAPQGQRAAALTQHVQAGGVVDLTVHQQHRGNARIARRAGLGCSAGVARICVRMSGEALSNAQSWPLDETQIDDWGAGHGIERACAQAGAVVAIAVPLGKTTACGGTENPDVHERVTCAGRGATGACKRQSPLARALSFKPCRSTSGDVHRDFKAEAEVAGLWCFPRSCLNLLLVKNRAPVALRKRRLPVPMENKRPPRRTALAPALKAPS